MDWIYLALNSQVVDSCEHGHETSGSDKTCEMSWPDEMLLASSHGLTREWSDPTCRNLP
jgi:hypothetical protein